MSRVYVAKERERPRYKGDYCLVPAVAQRLGLPEGRLRRWLRSGRCVRPSGQRVRESDTLQATL